MTDSELAKLRERLAKAIGSLVWGQRLSDTLDAILPIFQAELDAKDETIRKLRESLAKLLSMCDMDSDGETKWERAVDAARALLAEGEAHARHDG